MEKQRETYCEEFRLILDQEEKTVIVEPMRPGAGLKLSKDGALRLDCFSVRCGTGEAGRIGQTRQGIGCRRGWSVWLTSLHFRLCRHGMICGKQRNCREAGRRMSLIPAWNGIQKR